MISIEAYTKTKKMADNRKCHLTDKASITLLSDVCISAIIMTFECRICVNRSIASENTLNL